MVFPCGRTAAIPAGMADELTESAAEILASIDPEHPFFCGLDYDGTLAPLAPTPDAAVPFPGTIELLEALAASPRTTVAIVTGRAIADVRRFVALDELYYVGIHGLEVRKPRAATGFSAAGEEARRRLPALGEALQRDFGDLPGVLFENKGAALAVHYRLVARDAVDALIARVEDLVGAARADGANLQLLHGHEVCEIRPQGVDKGRTLCELLATDAPDAMALYAGDDKTDEDAFRALPAEAITIRVGGDPVQTRARWVTDGPESLHGFLQQVLSARR